MKSKIIQKHNPAFSKNNTGSTSIPKPDNWKNYIFLIFILLISLIVYIPSLNNGFVWDDELYVQNNPLIFSFNLKEIFSQNLAGNYHPVTILALAIEYHFFGLHETGYHVVNLLLHLLNVALVFYVIYLITDKMGVALIVSLLFGIHPMHVESVAWISEIKDLLYTFFFLATLIFYLKFLKNKQKKFYVITIVLFLLSLLSKAMAASLPVVLLLIDYFKGRKFTVKTLSEKVPFFILALIFGMVAIAAQKTAGASDMVLLPFPQRLVFACYGFISYIFKLLLPFNLSAYYPYPIKNGMDIPIQFYAYVLLFLSLAACTYYSLRFSRKLFFGVGFFGITVFLVLQLLPIGGAVMADRYSYIPSIGIFYLAGEAFFYLWNKKLQIISIALLGIFSVFFSAKTYARCGIWQNEKSLWSNVIDQYQTVPQAYYNRGSVLMNEKKFKEAFDDFNKTIELDPTHAKAYVNRGNVFRSIGRFDDGLNDLNKAIELSPDNAIAYNNRGNILMNKKSYQEALLDYNKAIELKPEYDDAYSNRGIVFAQTGKMNEALSDFSKSIELKPNAASYLNRAFVFSDLNKLDEALNDFNKAIELDRNNPSTYYSIGALFMKQKKYDEAIGSFSMATVLKSDYAMAYFQMGLAKYYKGETIAACADLNQAAILGYKPATDAMLQICK